LLGELVAELLLHRMAEVALRSAARWSGRVRGTEVPGSLLLLGAS
jgi:hypothetical protein